MTQQHDETKHPPAMDLDRFLQLAGEYKLGKLPTESRHSETMGLSDLAQTNVSEAVQCLRNVDLTMLETARSYEQEILAMSDRVSECLRRQGRIFLVGCGATGRLSLLIETLVRTASVESEDRVVSLMAGGDVALIQAIENFEDHPEFGARQLQELGFQEGDLLIASTEGGETPFVIGATEYAALNSREKPLFVYCNPDETLTQVAQRSKRVLENPSIEKINLYVGPMALSGSTRMQATSIQTVAVASAVFEGLGLSPRATFASNLSNFIDVLKSLDLESMVAFVEAEAAAYQNGSYVVYETDAYGMTVLTDTTERAPTFSLLPFERVDSDREPSLCFMGMRGAKDVQDAWKKLLKRPPRTIDWSGLEAIAGRRVADQFDFSSRVIGMRESRCKGPNQLFSILDGESVIVWSFGDLRWEIPKTGMGIVWDNLLIKILLNSHSTLVMGRLGRYQSNLMTWVRPTNLKLIDRAVRYILHLANDQGFSPSYEQAARACFEASSGLAPGEPVVLAAVERLCGEGSSASERSALPS